MSYGRSQCEESKENQYFYNWNLQKKEIYCLKIQLAHSLLQSGTKESNSVELVYVGQRFCKSTNASMSLLLELFRKACLELVEPSSILRNIDLCVLFRTLFGPQAITLMPLRHSGQKPFICFSDIQLPTSLSLPPPPDFQDHQNNLYDFIIQHEGNLWVLGSQLFNTRVICLDVRFPKKRGKTFRLHEIFQVWNLKCFL